jgi:hypothetical protein
VRGVYRVLKSIKLASIMTRNREHTVEEDLEGGGVLSVVGDDDT